MMEPHWYHVKIIPQLKKDKTIINYIAFYYNIDDKVQLKKEAHTDQLTGLMNRQYLQHIQLKINLNNFDVMIIDLDHFKVVNDSYGHQVGDSVLKNIALILRHLTNSNDILVRYGGEEFLYLLYNPLHDVNMTRDVSERIRLSIEETHIKYGAEDIKISASIGIDANTDMSQNFQEAISRADEMLYLAKRKGRNRIEVYAE